MRWREISISILSLLWYQPRTAAIPQAPRFHRRSTQKGKRDEQNIRGIAPGRTGSRQYGIYAIRQRFECIRLRSVGARRRAATCILQRHPACADDSAGWESERRERFGHAVAEPEPVLRGCR